MHLLFQKADARSPDVIGAAIEVQRLKRPDRSKRGKRRVATRIVAVPKRKDSQSIKAGWRGDAPRRPGCRDCPFRASSGACLDRTLKSGRCGDWVWFVLRGNKQFRRRWVKPNDPHSLRQRRWRARLSAASKRYSHSLTENQRDACIIAGAKRWSRPRLGQSGALTGQQYSVGKECAAYAREEACKVTMTRAKVPRPQGLAKTRLSQVPQHQRVARGTWEQHQGVARVSPGYGQGNKGRGRREEGGRKNVNCRGRRRETALRVRQERTNTLSAGERYRSVARTKPQPTASNARNSPPVGGRASWPGRRIKALRRRPACLPHAS